MSKSLHAMFLVIALTVLTATAASASAEDLVNTSGASGVALDGFDPVAFFTEKKPVNGNFKITAKHQGATYFFASEANKEMFAKNPAKYAPQHGGYCAFGVSVGALLPVDISTWQVIDGKLYLNLNHDIVKMFNENQDQNIANADKMWPELVKKHTK